MFAVVVALGAGCSSNKGKDKPSDSGEKAAEQDVLRAPELFQAMETKLARAKTVQFGFSIDFLFMGGRTTPPAGGQLEGTLAFAEGNKVQLTIQNSTGLAEQYLRQGDAIISNGTRIGEIITKQSGGKKGKDEGKDRKGEKESPPKKREVAPEDQQSDAPAHLTDVLTSLLTRAGLFQGFVRENIPGWFAAKQPFKAEDAFAVSDFKLGRKEKVAGHEAQVVEYQLKLKGDAVQVKVWIDSTTRLPLKREFTGDKARFTETYTDMKLDEKPDPSLFELPK